MFIFSKLCRLCMANKDVTLTLNHSDSENITLLDKFNLLASEILCTDNKLPNGICTKCTIQLNEAYKFIMNCIHMQKTFQRYLQVFQNGDNIAESNHLEILLNENQLELNFNNMPKKTENETDSNELTQIHFEEVEFPVGMKMEVINEESFNEINDNQVEKGDRQQSFIDSPINSKQGYLIGSDSLNCNLVKDYPVKLEDDKAKPNIHYQTIEDNLCESSSPEENNFCDFEFVECKAVNDIKMKNVDEQINDGPYKCEICEKGFSDISYLKKHVSAHTNRYKCVVCEKVFRGSSQLKLHLLIHTEEKPYVCEICKKGFRQSANLKVHVRIHTQEKPYPCELCEKAFTNGSHLKRHVRIHTNEKPYTCEICKKAFSDCSNFKNHIRIHDNVKLS